MPDLKVQAPLFGQLLGRRGMFYLRSEGMGMWLRCLAAGLLPLSAIWLKSASRNPLAASDDLGYVVLPHAGLNNTTL